MDIVLRTRDAIDILELRGSFAGAGDADRLRRALAPPMRLGAPIVIVDVTALDGLGAGILSELLETRRRVRDAGGIVKLVASETGCADLRDAGFGRLFEIYGCRDEAVESFEPETMTAGIP